MFAQSAAHILAKIHFNDFSAWSEIMSLKSDRLEILLSVYVFSYIGRRTSGVNFLFLFCIYLCHFFLIFKENKAKLQFLWSSSWLLLLANKNDYYKLLACNFYFYLLHLNT